MKYIFFIFIHLIISLPVAAQSTDILEIRKMYYQASESSKIADKFLKMLDNNTIETDPVLYGYKGMAKLMVCYHSYNPYTKLSYFAKGKGLLEEAISADPRNAELIYLRFSIQTNAPVFLNYNKNIKSDKAILFNYLKSDIQTIDRDLYERIKKYLLDSSHCSESEKAEIKALK